MLRTWIHRSLLTWQLRSSLRAASQLSAFLVTSSFFFIYTTLEEASALVSLNDLGKPQIELNLSQNVDLENINSPLLNFAFANANHVDAEANFELQSKALNGLVLSSELIQSFSFLQNENSRDSALYYVTENLSASTLAFFPEFTFELNRISASIEKHLDHNHGYETEEGQEALEALNTLEEKEDEYLLKSPYINLALDMPFDIQEELNLRQNLSQSELTAINIKDSILSSLPNKPDLTRLVQQEAITENNKKFQAKLASYGQQPGDRYLKLYNSNTHERLYITFRTAEGYNQEAIKKAEYFMRDWRSGKTKKLDPKLLDFIWETQQKLGSTSIIQINSGYRTPKSNRIVGGASASYHVRGSAVDMKIPDRTQPATYKTARKLSLDMKLGGVGKYRGLTITHMDTGPLRTWYY